MENHLPLQQQTVPVPPHVPAAVFIEGHGLISGPPTSEFSENTAETSTGQQQTTPFSGESGLEHSSRVFPMEARSPNPFDHQSNYQPGQSNYQMGGSLGLTQLMGPNFGAFGAVPVVSAVAPAEHTAPMAEEELNQDSASVITSASNASSSTRSTHGSESSRRRYRKLCKQMEELQTKASGDTERLVHQLLEQNSSLDKRCRDDAIQRHNEKLVDDLKASATRNELAQMAITMQSLIEAQARNPVPSHAPTVRAKPVSPIIPGGTVDNAGICKRRESMGFDSSTSSYETAGLRPKSHVKPRIMPSC
jgi:hypothetical protein